MSLQLKNISKVFDLPGKEKFRAVTGVNLTIPQGQFVTLLGPSGCGKTTLLRMIAGFETPTVGSLVYNGQDITSWAPQKRGFPMVFQSYALFPHMTVSENVGYGLKVRKVEKSEIQRRVQEILKLLELTVQASKFPHQMSGGQQQRVALARALVLEPRIILFDEPLSNLDAKLRVYMRDEIRRLQKRLGLTAIYVTHDQEEAMAISDLVVVLNKGQIEQMGSADQVYRRPATEFVAKFMGNANLFQAQKIAASRFHILGAEYDFGVEGASVENRSQATVVVRPESVRIAKTPLRHTGVVRQTSYLGSSFMYSIQCDQETFAAHVPWDGVGSPLAEGDKIFFEIDQSNVHVI